MKKVFIILAFIAGSTVSVQAAQLSVYDCGSIARINKEVEAQSSHSVEIKLDPSLADSSLLPSIKLVSLDGNQSFEGNFSKDTIIFPVVSPGEYRICDPAIKGLVSKVTIEDSVAQASARNGGLTNVVAGAAAIGGGFAAIALGNNSSGNQAADSASRATTTSGQISIDSGPTADLAANSTKSPGRPACFVGQDEPPISPFS